ncbi:M28 family metallopeptidase [Gaiella sp.]|uniref:M28 family metallopeptidase n=1 Tax=Gaiella sp. TaxID=2663207 RepID=UPI003982D91A
MSPRRRQRDQPINGALVRASFLLLLLPLLVLAFTTATPGPFPAPSLPPAFDGASATQLATELARDFPDREPGTEGALGATSWVNERLALYGLPAAEDAWDEAIPGLGTVRLRNLVTVIPGASSDAILFLAHRDNTGREPGANDNASGTAALIELARGFGRLGTIAGRPKPEHTLIFLSSDGGAYGGFGAERFAANSPLREDVRAVVSLDAIGSSARPRLEISGLSARSPTPALVRTADVRVADQLGTPPLRPGWLVQLVNLGIPFGYGEQAPFLGREISAVRLTTAEDGGGGAADDTPARLDRPQFVRLGRAAESILASLDNGIELAGGTNGYVYLGTRVVRGWAIEFVLLVALVPFLVGVVDLFARSRRKRLPLTSALLALRTRLGVWLWVGLAIGLGALTGVFPRGAALPPSPDSPAVTDWPVVGLAAIGIISAIGWWRGGRALAPRVAPRADELLAGYTVSLLALAGIAIATAGISPYALLFLIPSLYAWLWLPQVTSASWLRDVLYGLGLTGPVLALVAVGTQLDLGLNTPLYLVSLMTLGFISWPTVLVLIAWAAVATQLAALASGRYTPAARLSRSERKKTDA